MTRNRLAILLFLLTFAVLLLDPRPASPAALWPSVLAITLAFVTRNIFVSLLVGAYAGAILLNQGNVASAFLDLFSRYLLPALESSWNLSVLVFTLMMGGFVEVLNRNGGTAALADRVLGRARGRRPAGLATYGLGLLFFVDGLANSMLIGKSMRPVTDRAGISREKLAFIVDSTSSPIAGLALVSTWVAYEISVIREGFLSVAGAEGVAPYQILVESLPYRFYNYFALWIVFLSLWMVRDLGPMVAAERRAKQEAPGGDDTSESVRGKAWLAVVPLVVLVSGVLVGLWVEGGGPDLPFTKDGIIEALGKANAALVFVWATAASVLLTLGATALFGPKTEAGEPTENWIEVFFSGMNKMFVPALILVFAWMLNGVIKEMETSSYLVGLIGNDLPAGVLPAAVFILAAIISFSTGTSWGTMAVVMPLVVPVACALTGYAGGEVHPPVVVATVGAVLAGAVFGDHCSPISDTTLVSSLASGCEPMAHVRTQVPYALSAALIAVLLGYGPAGFAVSPWILLPAGLVAAWAWMRWGGTSTR